MVLGHYTVHRRPANRASFYLRVLAILGVVVCLAACEPNEATTSKNADSAGTAEATPSIILEADMAPTYEEIHTTMHKLAKYDESPDGPDVGLDGLVDQGIREAVYNYEASLLGKKAVDWVGWLGSVNEESLSKPELGYSVRIVMEDPMTSPRDVSKTVLLRRVPREQIEKMDRYRAFLERPPGDWSSPLPLAAFSGTIEHMSYTGEVILGDVTVRQVNTKSEHPLP